MTTGNETLLIDLDIFTIADLRVPGTLAAIGAALGRRSAFRPERFGPTDPPGTRVTSLETQLREWEPRVNRERNHYFFFKRRSPPKTDGATLFIEEAVTPTLSRGHYLLYDYAAEWFDEPQRLEQLANLFRELCAVMGAYYGVARPSTMWLRGEKDYERGLPDLFWLNYFGPAFKKRWGQRLSAFGIRQDQVDGGASLVWGSPTPFDAGILATERQRATEALGRDTFASTRSRRGEPGEFVPFFSDHQRYAPGGERWLRGYPG